MHQIFQVSKPLQNQTEPFPFLQVTTYHSLTEPYDVIDVADELATSIPVIDFSLLSSDDPEIHTKVVHELAKACSEWGFFMVTFSFLPLFLVVIQMINLYATRPLTRAPHGSYQLKHTHISKTLYNTCI